MAQQPVALAKITPVQRAVAAVPEKALAVPERPAARVLSPKEKAAIIVRFLISEGSALPITALPDHMQAALAEQMGQMRLVDRKTLFSVVEEFLNELEQVGLSFPGGIEGALSMMDGHISPNAASRLRRLAGASAKADPWDRLMQVPNDRLLPILDREATEVAAVMLSKLPVQKAAELLGKMPGERARRVAYAVSRTGNVDPETVRRIGNALVAQLDADPPKAFDSGPVERVGAILNISPSLTREDVLQGLEAEDAGFAEQVRRAILTFAHLPKRLAARDVPKVVRIVDQPVLVTALAASVGKPDLEAASEHLLANMSQRMAQSLREEMAARGKVKDKDAEEAMSAVIVAIRQLQSGGELVLIEEDNAA